MAYKIGFIGAGNMAEALVRGLLSSGKFIKKDITLSDIDSERLNYIKDIYSVRTTSINTEVTENCDIVLFCVKPSKMSEVIGSIKNSLSSKNIYVSIAAGITTGFIVSKIKKTIKLARVMPNTPCLVQEGMCGIYFSDNFEETEKQIITDIFQSVGKTVNVSDENELDAITGISGSGPAYAALVMESLADGGVRMGLSRETSLQLAAQTLMGSAKLILQTGMKPSELKDKVTSPAGTTIEGIHVLEEYSVRSAFISAVEAATRRSREISLKGDE